MVRHPIVLEATKRKLGVVNAVDMDHDGVVHDPVGGDAFAASLRDSD